MKTELKKEHILIFFIVTVGLFLIGRVLKLDSSAIIPALIIILTPLITAFFSGLSGKKFWCWSGLGLLLGCVISIFTLDYYSEFGIYFYSSYLLIASLVVYSAGRFDKNDVKTTHTSISITSEEQPIATFKISKGNLFFLFYVSILIGLQLDIYFFHAFLDNTSMVNINFVFTIPLYVAVLIIAVYLFKLKNRVGIIILSVAISVISMILTFLLYESRRGYGFDYFEGALFLIGLAPSSFIGACYGLCLSSQIHTIKKPLQANDSPV